MTRRVALDEGGDLAGFRRAVRVLVAERVPPEEVVWSIGAAPEQSGDGTYSDAPPVLLPRAVGELVERLAAHPDPECYSLLYRLIWRVLHGERTLLENRNDPLVRRLELVREAEIAADPALIQSAPSRVH